MTPYRVVIWLDDGKAVEVFRTEVEAATRYNAMLEGGRASAFAKVPGFVKRWTVTEIDEHDPTPRSA